MRKPSFSAAPLNESCPLENGACDQHCISAHAVLRMQQRDITYIDIDLPFSMQSVPLSEVAWVTLSRTHMVHAVPDSFYLFSKGRSSSQLTIWN